MLVAEPQRNERAISALLAQQVVDRVTGRALDVALAAVGQGRLVELLVDHVVGVGLDLLAVLALFGLVGGALQPPHDLVDFIVELLGLFRHPGDDERRARLVDKDRVHLVDDGEAAHLLHLLRGVDLHVVAQVVEAKLVVLSVDDVGGILL